MPSYNGAIYDESTGLYYLSARYYDPEDGRFLTRDSYRGNAANPMTWHLYAYCANNPVNYEDPSGHIAFRTIVGGVIGVVAGVVVGSKIAKKANAKGWKKIAIVAGCAVAGGAVGAVVGTVATPKNITSAVKRVASYAKNKLPNKTTLKTVKTALSNTKSSVGKIVTKTKELFKSVKNRVTQFGKKSNSQTNPSALKYNGDGTWTSNKGLVYGQGSKDGNRVKHVLQHIQPNSSKPLHTVFNVDKSEVIGLIDEAWINRGRGLLQSNGNVLYDINMGKIIGTNGENIIRIITQGYSNNIITAFPRG